MTEEDFESVIEKWIKELIEWRFPLRLRSRYRLKGDSGNYHEIDFIIEGAVAPPENYKELLKSVEEAHRRVEENRELSEKSLDARLALIKSIDDFVATASRLLNAFTYDAKILIEVKGMGWAGEKPTEQTYREHMLRAYACLGDYRNQKDKKKYVIVPYKSIRQRASNYESYFKSINTTLLDYSDPKERSILEDEIKRLREELMSKLRHYDLKSIAFRATPWLFPYGSMNLSNASRPRIGHFPN
ncbi:MAG: hypothetical protein QXD42_03995 [Nitrososphaerales archaeon]